jgi:hypothetical protein
MTEQTATLPLALLPAEALAFAVQQRVSEYLPAVIDLTRRVFPASVLHVCLGEDAEDENHRYIALDVEVGAMDLDELLAAQRAWSAGLFAVCPASQAVHFVLGWL